MSDSFDNSPGESDFLGDVFGAAMNPNGFEVEGYEILGELERGGMGIVYLARQLHPEREVALKVMLPQHAYEEQMRQRFFRETRAMASLDHAGILPIYEVGEADQIPFFSMKLAHGGSLSDRLKEHPQGQSPEQASELIRGVALALHHAHQKGVLHRDIKPGNLLFGASGRVYVSDFGVAKLTETDLWGLTKTESFVGTPDYIPPELVENAAESTIAGDIYSLGAVFYECLTGRKLFQDTNNLASHLRAVVEEPVVPPSRYEKKIPKDLETVCLKALAKKPGDRYSSAEEFAKDLERWQKGLPVVARPLNLWQRSLRYVRRNALLSTAFFLIGAISITAAGVVIVQRAEARKADRMRVFSLLIEQARAERLLGKPGFRGKVLALLRDADEISDSPQILDEAIATLAQPDLTLVSRGNMPSEEAVDWKTGPQFPPNLVVEKTASISGQEVVLARDEVGRVTLWAEGEGKPRRVWVPIEGNRIVAEFLPQQEGLVVAGGERQLALFGIEKGEFRKSFPLPGGKIAFVSASPEGMQLAIGGSFGVGILDSGTAGWSWQVGRPLRCEPMWSQDGSLVAVALGDKKEIQVFDSASGQEYCSFGTTGWPEMLALDPKGRYVVVACDDDTVFIFDLPKRSLLARLSSDASSIRFSEQGQGLRIGAPDGSFSQWRFEGPKGYHPWYSPLSQESVLTFRSASLSPNQEWLLLTFNECLQIYCVREGRLRGYYATSHQRIDSPAGAWWLPGEGNRVLLQVPGAWDILEVDEKGALNYLHPSEARLPGVKIVEIDPNGDWLVNVLYEDGETESEIWSEGDENRSRASEPISPNQPPSLQRATQSVFYRAEIIDNGVIEIEDRFNGTFRLTFPEGTSVKHLFFLEGGQRLVCVSFDNQLIEWNLPHLRKNLKKLGFDPSLK